MKNKIKISFWGVRGSIPTPGENTVYYGGNTSCVTIEYKDEIIILDAGSGIREFGKYLIKQGKISNNKIHIFISHTHWDHIQGLPFFASAFIKGNKIRIYGPKLFNQSFERILSNQMEYNYFPVRLEDLEADISFEELKIGKYNNIIPKVKIETMVTNHPVIDMGYKFSFGKIKVAYITDFEILTDQYFDYVYSGKDDIKKKIGKELFKNLNNRLIKFLKNSDFLIMDSFCTKEEYKDKLGWGHSCFEDVYNLAKKSKVKKLCFFHHDPNRTDESLKKIEKLYQELNKKEKCFEKIFAAKEKEQLFFEY